MKIHKFRKKSLAQATHRALSGSGKSLSVAILASVLYCTPTFAISTGAVKGSITTDSDGVSVSGVTVTATSDVMPKARSVVTGADGNYNLPLLIPGVYKITMTSADGSVESSTVEVLLDQTSSVNFTLERSSSDNVITIIGSSTIITEGNSALTNSLGQDTIESLPIGQTYRDMLKLIPGAQYSENSTLGPSAGGSGRDNKYGFDGVDVSLPMFGNLSAEPSTHDVQSVAIDLGGAKAIGFNRSGGFAVDTISKSGTNEFHGDLEYKLQAKNFVGDRKNTNPDSAAYQYDKNWLTASFSGPLIEDTLFFYGSFYRPETTRSNKETAYGPAQDYEQIREEYYGKFTYAPTDDLLFNLSLRTSDNEGSGESVGGLDMDSTSESSNAYQDIYTFDGSWIIDTFTTLTFTYGKFDYETRGGPDTLLSFAPTLGQALDLNNLGQLGFFRVPYATNDAQDQAVAQALIDQYGYVGDDGTRYGGGGIGAGSTINDQNFYRESFEIALDHEMDIGSATHKFHIGYQWKEGTEELSRLSNGWGSIMYMGGEEAASNGTPIYYRSITQQMSLIDASGAAVPTITSSSEQSNFEINDTIEAGDFTYNIGFLISNDILYGQGLKADSSTISGFVDSPGTKYKMHEVDWSDMIQPRIGITWAYNGEDTVFLNYAKYNPEASSLSRAASWARNTRSALNVDFDVDGNFIQSEERDGSSGKFFQDGIKPRQIVEFTLGTSQMVTPELHIRAHVRRREGKNFWEDTWNGSRLYGEYGPWGGVPDEIAALGYYIPDLDDWRDQLQDSRPGASRGSSYVIAALDGAYTSYNEVHVEAEWQGDRTYLKASYTWNHYYGNFDQDSVSGSNDANLFIGSSNLADGRGRQLWDGKNGKLYGDRPRLLKLYGYYTTDWDANIGFYTSYQSGDVWEAWDGTPYGYSSSTIRFTERAGSRRGEGHWQFDLNYTQNFELTADYTLEFRADLFNVFDNQTGYRNDPYLDNASFGQPRSQYNPRRLQLSGKISF